LYQAVSDEKYKHQTAVSESQSNHTVQKIIMSVNLAVSVQTVQTIITQSRNQGNIKELKCQTHRKRSQMYFC
jgi:hypothetical protein